MTSHPLALHLIRITAPILISAVLAACGGNDSPRTSAVKVAGDSLNDAGTFGAKATVQSAAGTPTVVWPDVVASAVGAPNLCPRYSANATTGAVALNTNSGCTSYAVAGAQINPTAPDRDGTGYSVVRQLEELGAGGYRADELLLVDGGGNDAAALMGAFIGAVTPSGFAAYGSLLAELLTPAQLAAISPVNPSTLFNAGTQYMVALANLLVDTIDSQAIAKGAQRVALMNMPNIVRTPRFQNVLAGVSALAGQGAADQAAAAGTTWVRAFNSQLATRLQGRSNVVLVDVSTEFDRWIDAPATYGFSNVTQPACPVVGTSNGLPTYSLATCNTTSLSASPPGGIGGPDWWRSYLFADNFHGTPRTNQLIGELFVKAIEARGWK